MEYSINHEGKILLVTSPREAEVITKALISKQLEMRKTQERKEHLDEALTIMMVVNSALMDSNKKRVAIKPSEPQASKEVFVVEPKKPFWYRVKSFFNPRFTTDDFDEARTLCGIKHLICSMDFENPNHPINVKGEVFHEGRWLFVSWDEFGKCSSTAIKDAHCYDLILPDHGKQTSAKCLVVGAAFLIISLLIYAIIQ